MSLLFHRSLFGVFDIFLAIAGTAAGAYLYTQFMRRQHARRETEKAFPNSPTKVKKSSKSIRRVYSKKGSDSKSPKSPKKSGRSRPVKSTVTVSTPKDGMRLRTPAVLPAVAENPYQSLNDASKQESAKNDAPSAENSDTPDNSSR